MSRYTYTGIAYRQSLDPKAPWLVSFVTSAEELLKWAGIPRRAEDREIGFQRTDNEKRVERAKRFFQFSGNNQSPTALVVGIHPVAPDGKRLATLEFLGGHESDTVRTCKLTIESNEDETLEQVIERIKSQVQMRLRHDDGLTSEEADADDLEEADLEDIVNSETGEDAANAAEGEDEEDVLQVTGERQVELGRSILDRFLEKLENPKWCSENEEHLREIGKPATVIDGQHRALGAARCERGIPFAVCALFDCAWSEQVFQFTVVNYTSQGIPDQFITANASLSLTGKELGQLEERLVQAEVKVIEYTLMSVVNFDTESPFYGLVNLTEKKEKAKIGYKTMVQVARIWYEAKDRGVQKLVRHLYPEITGRDAASRRMEKWKDEGDWGKFFITFWSQVASKYRGGLTHDGKDLWGVGSNLLIAVVLLEFQMRFLIFLANQADSSFAAPSGASPRDHLLTVIPARANEFLQCFPLDFFGCEWKTKSLSTGAGRDVLKSALRELVDSGGSFRYANSRLVKGSSS